MDSVNLNPNPNTTNERRGVCAVPPWGSPVWRRVQKLFYCVACFLFLTLQHLFICTYICTVFIKVLYLFILVGV